MKSPLKILLLDIDLRTSDIKRDGCVPFEHFPVERTISFHFPPKQPRILSRSMVIVRKSKMVQRYSEYSTKKREKRNTSEGISFLSNIDLWEGPFHSIFYRTNATGSKVG